jgi:hypothetical protein
MTWRIFNARVLLAGVMAMRQLIPAARCLDLLCGRVPSSISLSLSVSLFFSIEVSISRSLSVLIPLCSSPSLDVLRLLSNAGCTLCGRSNWNAWRVLCLGNQIWDIDEQILRGLSTLPLYHSAFWIIKLHHVGVCPSHWSFGKHHWRVFRFWSIPQVPSLPWSRSSSSKHSSSSILLGYTDALVCLYAWLRNSRHFQISQ